MAQELCELLWSKIILDDLRIKGEGLDKVVLDNKLVINIAHNPIQHDGQGTLKLINILSWKN